MTPERWEQVREILDGALALDADARDEYLASTCAGHDDLRREVESLLASYVPEGHHFLDTPALQAHGGPAPAELTSSIGRRVGAYEILEEIGHGGMGEVYRARRADGQYDQQVAIKLIRSGLEGRRILLDRFKIERQILAKFDHPNIARLLDGGTADNGVPYLVMELVDGIGIQAYCDTRGLDVRSRLKLFLRVCAAVQYAHQHLVVHRDIKPSQILVTVDGVPKLLDFGVAKMLDPVGRVQETMLRPYTPEFASPEQVRGEPVSTATDVYSLAVVLYTLLTGHSPYRVARQAPGDLADAITRHEPERPSIVAPEVEGLRGDLDFILLKALRKEPEKRYSSVEQFADDIRRYLDGLPVRARKGKWNYRAGKFVRRHRTSVAAAALVALTLVAGIVLTLREARIAEANRRRADARFNDVRKLANSLIFEVHDSIQNLPGATDARKLILQRSLEYLDSLAKEAANEPDLTRELASAYSRIGQLQGNPFSVNLGETNKALASYQKSMALRESLARANPRSHRDQVELAAVYLAYGEFQAGAAGNARSGFDYVTQALAILDREAQAAPGDVRTVAMMSEILLTRGMMQTGNGLMAMAGSARQGVSDLENSLHLTQQALQLSPGNASLAYRQATIELSLGQALLNLGERPEALSHIQRSIELFDPMVRTGDDLKSAFNRTVAYGKMGDLLLIEGRTSEAVRYYAEHERLASSLATTDPHNESLQREEAVGLVQLGHALVELGRLDEGLGRIRQALVMIDADSTDTPLGRSIEALIRGWFGEALERQGKIREASHEYAVVKERLGAVRAKGINDPRVLGYFASAADRLAATYVKLGDVDKATQEYEEARTVLEPLIAANPDDQELAYVLAETYTGEGTISAARAEHDRARDDKLADLQAATDWFRKSLSTWSTVPHPARTSTSGFEVTVPSEVSRRVAHCDQEIRSLGDTRLDQPSNLATASSSARAPLVAVSSICAACASRC